jgi:hypothetical protein
MSDLHKAAQQALWAFQCHVEQTWPIDRSTAAIAALRTALAQQAEPKGGGNLPPPLQAEPVTEDMKSAVRWAPSSAYWSKRLREFFGPDAREGIDALERRIAGAQERAEPDLSRCPQCNGPADNGHDRSIPPNPYLCTRCMAEPVHKCPNCASLEAQNTELDLKLAELERAIGKEPVAWIHTDPDKPRVRFLEWREDEPGYRGRWVKTPLYLAPPQRLPLTEEPVAYREDIIRMAREAASEDGSIDRKDGKNVVLYAAKTSRFLERLAALAAAAEREACAKVCDDKAKETFSGQCQVWGDYFARVIRARSNT